MWIWKNIISSSVGHISYDLLTNKTPYILFFSPFFFFIYTFNTRSAWQWWGVGCQSRGLYEHWVKLLILHLAPDSIQSQQSHSASHLCHPCPSHMKAFPDGALSCTLISVPLTVFLHVNWEKNHLPSALPWNCDLLVGPWNPLSVVSGLPGSLILLCTIPHRSHLLAADETSFLRRGHPSFAVLTLTTLLDLEMVWEFSWLSMSSPTLSNNFFPLWSSCSSGPSFLVIGMDFSTLRHLWSATWTFSCLTLDCVLLPTCPCFPTD